jgi:hypothetical protein
MCWRCCCRCCRVGDQSLLRKPHPTPCRPHMQLHTACRTNYHHMNTAPVCLQPTQAGRSCSTQWGTST